MRRVCVLNSRIIAVILFGIIFVWSVTAMFVSGSVNLDCFYDVGKVYEMEQQHLQRSLTGWTYDQENKCIEISEDITYNVYPIKDTNAKWNYLVFEVEELSSDSLEFQIAFYNSNGEIVENISYAVCEGRNVVVIPSVSCVRYIITIENANGIKFRLENMELRQKLADWSWQTVLVGIITGCGLYTIFLWFIFWGKKKLAKSLDFYVAIDGLQSLYIKIMEKVRIHISEKQRKGLRIAILLFLFLSMHVRELWSTEFVENMCRVEAVYCLGIILFAVLLVQDVEEIQRRDWKNPLVYTWFVIGLIQCVSDFIVEKRYPFEGYMKLLVFGFLFFVWNNLKEKDSVVKEIVFALKADFIVCVAFCILFRPYTQGINYLGCYTNSNTFGMYLVIILGALAQSCWNRLRSSGKVSKVLGDVILQIVALELLWKSQCRGAMIAWLLGVLGTGILVLLRRKEKEIIYGVKIVVVCTLLAVPIGTVLDYGLQNVAEKLGTIVAFEQDETVENDMQMHFGSIEVHAADLTEKLSESKWIKKIQSGSIEEFSSGRTIIWKDYLRNINLFGHYFRLETNGAGNYAHNEILQHVYNYGIFMFVPYVFLLFYIIKYAWSYSIRGGEMWLVVWNTFSSWVIMGMIDVTDLQFRLFTWLIPGVLVGFIFEKNSELRIIG